MKIGGSRQQTSSDVWSGSLGFNFPIFYGIDILNLFPAADHGAGVSEDAVSGGDHVDMDDHKRQDGKGTGGVQKGHHGQ